MKSLIKYVHNVSDNTHVRGIPDKTSKQTHTFRSVAFNNHGSFEVEIYVSNKREPVHTRNLYIL
jgi:hypothetical protein